MKHKAMFYNKIQEGAAECFLCAHKCVIAQGALGKCRQRQNIDGTLYTHAYGELAACCADPIEKKPLYHFLPGTKAFSIACLGCNFQCGFCQNWQISQKGAFGRVPLRHFSPEDIVISAISQGCDSIAYTYTEPTVFFEYSFDTAKLAKSKGLSNIYVTNGYMSKEALDSISPFLDAANVDIKSFSDDFYKRICKARLAPVLDTIRRMKSLGIHIEITTLILTGYNDSETELRHIAEFIAGVDANIPWHLSRSHADYMFKDMIPTPYSTIEKALDIGLNAGLKYVYPGNM